MPNGDRDRVYAALGGRFQEVYAALGAVLRPDGATWRGPCPIHGGHGPHFVVYPDSGRFECFSECGGGDVFEFVERIHGSDFRHALEWLANFANVDLNKPGSGSPRNTPRRAERPRASLPWNIKQIVEDCHQRLLDDAEMLDFLHNRRGLTDATIAQYKLGVIAREADHPFRRLSIPLYDAAGSIVNVRLHLPAYRTELTEERRRQLNKVLPWTGNLPDSAKPLFPIAALAGAKQVLVVEGELDAILGNQLLSGTRVAVVTGTSGAGTWREEWTSLLARRA